MIPKIIHYCWFGKKPMPITDQMCLASWQRFFPDWKLMLWNEDTFNEENDYLLRMIKEKKWSLYTDYVRFWALEKYGGLYFDTDIEVIKPFNDILFNSYFLGFEKPGQVNIAVIGSEKNHPFNRLILDYYESYRFDDEIKWSVLITGPLMAKLNNIVGKNEVVEFMPNSFIYPVDYFYPLPYEDADTLNKKKYLTKNSYTLHYWNATWVDPWSLIWAGRRKTGWKMVFRSIFENPFQPFSFYRNMIFHLKCSVLGYPKL